MLKAFDNSALPQCKYQRYLHCKMERLSIVSPALSLLTEQQIYKKQVQIFQPKTPCWQLFDSINK